jgi:hypothetical protein
MATNDDAARRRSITRKRRISDDARPPLVDVGNVVFTAAQPKSKALLDCSKAPSPLTLSLFENGDEEETTVVNDKEVCNEKILARMTRFVRNYGIHSLASFFRLTLLQPPLVPEKPNQVNDGELTFKKVSSNGFDLSLLL